MILIESMNDLNTFKTFNYLDKVLTKHLFMILIESMNDLNTFKHSITLTKN